MPLPPYGMTKDDTKEMQKKRRECEPDAAQRTERKRKVENSKEQRTEFSKKNEKKIIMKNANKN